MILSNKTCFNHETGSSKLRLWPIIIFIQVHWTDNYKTRSWIEGKSSLGNTVYVYKCKMGYNYRINLHINLETVFPRSLFHSIYHLYLSGLVSRLAYIQRQCHLLDFQALQCQSGESSIEQHGYHNNTEGGSEDQLSNLSLCISNGQSKCYGSPKTSKQ